LAPARRLASGSWRDPKKMRKFQARNPKLETISNDQEQQITNQIASESEFRNLEFLGI
jgi:hypothetical protein